MTEMPITGYYKPGITLDTPLEITLAAADWITFGNWLDEKEDQMVCHITQLIRYQIGQAVFDQAALKAARARMKPDGGDPIDFLRSLGAQVGTMRMGPDGPEFISTEVPDPEDFGSQDPDA